MSPLTMPLAAQACFLRHWTIFVIILQTGSAGNEDDHFFLQIGAHINGLKEHLPNAFDWFREEMCGHAVFRSVSIATYCAFTDGVPSKEMQESQWAYSSRENICETHLGSGEDHFFLREYESYTLLLKSNSITHSVEFVEIPVHQQFVQCIMPWLIYISLTSRR